MKKQILEELSKELLTAYEQVKFFQSNLKNPTALPQYLGNKVAYLRAYVRAIKKLEETTANGTINNIAKRIQDNYFR